MFELQHDDFSFKTRSGCSGHGWPRALHATVGERALAAVNNFMTITDLHVPIFTAMGISPKTTYDIEERPFYATEDGKGVAVRNVFG